MVLMMMGACFRSKEIMLIINKLRGYGFVLALLSVRAAGFVGLRRVGSMRRPWGGRGFVFRAGGGHMYMGNDTDNFMANGGMSDGGTD